jgi:hypothetical protein
MGFKRIIMKKFAFIFGIIIASLTSTNAQSNNFEIELDPLAYALGGVSGHIAYAFKNQRIQFGYAQLTVPEATQTNEGVTEFFVAFPTLKWDFFFGCEDASQGFFAGPTLDYLMMTYGNEVEEVKGSKLNLGIRGGYKFNLFKKNKVLSGLYLTPWLGFSYNTLAGNSDFELGDEIYSTNPLTVFPTLHLGWSF